MTKLLAGRRSGIVRMFPETDKSTMLPNTTPKVNRGRAEVGKKVNTMTERNKVASPTSNPGSDTSPRNKNPRWPAKRKFQQGGLLRTKPIIPEQDPEFMFKSKYNTELTPEEKPNFDAWVKAESAKQGRDIMMDQGAYDVQGFWKSGDYAKRDSDGHGTDTWKKPNHPTFSNESKYHGADGFYAGEWGKDGSYFPSRQTRELYSPDYYKRLFGAEPNRPEHLNLSKSTNFTPSIYQEGGKLIPRKELSPAQLDSTVQAWRKSPEWYNQASGRAEITDSPIDMVLLGGAAIYAGKASGFLSRYITKKADQELGKVLAGQATKLGWSETEPILGSLAKTAERGIPGTYWVKQGVDLLNNK